MAIQNRRGPYDKLDERKLRPGEWAIVLEKDPFCQDGKAVYICFRAGDTKRMATYEDMIETFDEHTADVIQTLTQEINAATQRAIDAAEYSDNAGASALDNSQKAETAANLVIVAINDLDARRLAGEFNGPQGPQGIPGRDGANGVVTTMQGQYAFQIVNGHLHLIYVDGTEPPNYEIVENGHLILTIPAT